MCVLCLQTLLHTHDVSVPEDVMSTWLASFPKLLWLLGSECAATTSAVLQIMLRMAHRGCIGDDEVRAKMVRSCIPLLGATKRVVDIEAAHALPICFGPFIAWEPTSQRLFLAFLTVMNFWPWQLLRGIAAVFSHASLVASMRADVLRAPLLSMATCCPSHSPSVCGQQCQDIADFIMCCLLHSDELVQRVCPPTGSEPALTYATWAPGVECADSDLALHELVADAVRTFPACSTLLGRIVLLLRSVSLQSLSTSGLFAVCALLNALRQFSAGLADDVPALLCAFVDHNAAVLVPALIRTSADTPEVRAHRLCRAMLSAYPTCVASVLGSLSFAIVREDVSTSALTDTKNFLSIDGIRAIISSHVTELTAMYNTASCLAARLDAVGVIAASVKAMLQSYLRV